MTITAKELAQKLGISPATVSMVLNNKPGISQPTRQRILEAAQEFGYAAPQKAAPPVAGQDTICFVIYKRSNGFVTDTPFFSQLSEGIEAVCQKNQYHFSIRYLVEDTDLESQIHAINSTQYSGVILLATRMTSEAIRLFEALETPLLILDAYFETENLPCVVINNAQGAFLATDYLITQRNQQPGYLASSMHITNFDERADGFYRAVRKHGMSASDCIVHRLTPTEEGACRDMLDVIQSGEPLAKCYFADNDHVAIGAMKALQQSGYRIPEDVGIAGFDDLPLCEYLNPPLTTISIPKKYMGEAAAAKLIDMIRTGDRAMTKLAIGTTLKKRGSV